MSRQSPPRPDERSTVPRLDAAMPTVDREFGLPTSAKLVEIESSYSNRFSRSSSTSRTTEAGLIPAGRGVPQFASPAHLLDGGDLPWRSATSPATRSTIAGRSEAAVRAWGTRRSPSPITMRLDPEADHCFARPAVAELTMPMALSRRIGAAGNSACDNVLAWYGRVEGAARG